MSAPRFFLRIPVCATDGEALDLCDELRAAAPPVLHAHQGGEVVGSVEVSDPQIGGEA